MKPLTLALAKGRILEDTLPLLERIGVRPQQDLARKRELRIAAEGPVGALLIVRSSDVPTYVEHGAAQLGIAGKDVLREHGSSTLYEPLDLNIARCRLCVAAPVGWQPPQRRRWRIATKYVQQARDYFAERGQQVEIIKLYGSMELAPLVGLADAIVDLVDTGNTLKANGLEPIAEINSISSRLIVNKAAMKLQAVAIREFTAALEAQLAR